MKRFLQVSAARFALKRPFRISRGVKSHADVITVTIREGLLKGQGEGVPYPRYGENVPDCIASLENIRAEIEAGADRNALTALLPPGAARAAADAALIDLEAKRRRLPAWEILGLPEPRPVTTAVTISLDDPETMAGEAGALAAHPLLKIKLGEGLRDLDRLRAVRFAAPDADLIVDANEGWRPEDLLRIFAACQAFEVRLIEQPLPAGADDVLETIARPVPVYADESLHGQFDWERLKRRYDGINVKLDKIGGLTSALSLVREARMRNMGVMAGCMVGSSLAMAPAHLLAQAADYADLDGPWLLAEDRTPAMTVSEGRLSPPDSKLWG